MRKLELLQLPLNLNKYSNSKRSQREREPSWPNRTKGTKAALLKQRREQPTIRGLQCVIKDKYSDKAGMKETKISFS